jgi:hypothetical protein
MPVTTVDPRCLRDGAYCRGLRNRILWRCLGERIVEGPGDPRRVGYEDVSDPGEVRWVTRTSIFTQRLAFVCQGEPSSDREVIEALP